MNQLLPATKEYFKKVYESIIGSVKKNRDVHLIGLRESGKTYVMKMLALSKQGVSFRKLYPRVEVFFIDQDLVGEEEFVWLQLAKQMDIESSENISVLFHKILSYVDDKTRNKGYTLVLILNQLLTWRSLSSDLIDKLLKIKTIFSEKVKFVIISNAFEDYSSSQDYLDTLSILNFKRIWFPILSLEDTKKQIAENRVKAGKSIKEIESESYFEIIFRLSGGIPGITKKLMSVPLKGIEGGPEDLLKNKSIIQQLLFTLKGIDFKYLDLLKKGKYSEELYKSGLTDRKGRIKSSLIMNFLENFDYKTMLRQKAIPEQLLSVQEKKVYDLLKKNKGETVAREEIAQVMWGEEYTQKYSDWAIDSLIKRIRQKIPTVKIVTQKGKGYVFK
ncbi:winged helix-turn-helix domain-containing protein [Candidatus Dojkabacteria bacterium]|nr:winged helix-turn-helix domain-containing protein [Candidatus Dojkabacteria bacterium]